MLTSQGRFDTLSAEGVTVRDYLAAAVATPAVIGDQVDEGDLVTALGADPFICTLD